MNPKAKAKFVEAHRQALLDKRAADKARAEAAAKTAKSAKKTEPVKSEESGE